MFFQKNLVFFFLVFVFSIGYLVVALSLGNPILDNRVEPSFFPIILGFFSVLFSSILFLREIKSNKKRAEFEFDIKSKDIILKKDNNISILFKYASVLIILSIFLYILMFAFIGYFASSFLFVLSIIVIFSSFEKIIQKSIISIVIVLVGYLVFDQLFGVRLPALWS